MSRKGYLLIEVIIGLSIFTLVAGAVTQGFLVGLKLYDESEKVDLNEGIITNILLNRIKKTTDANSPVNAKFGPEEWKAEVITKSPVKEISQNLYALNVEVAKTIDAQGNRLEHPTGKKYAVFRYLP
jgi:hypothetical protein